MHRRQNPCRTRPPRPIKGHELTALSEVLCLLDLSGGALLRFNALGCQPEIAWQMTTRGGHYLLVLRRNQRTLCAKAARAFTGLVPGPEAQNWIAGNVSVHRRISV